MRNYKTVIPAEEIRIVTQNSPTNHNRQPSKTLSIRIVTFRVLCRFNLDFFLKILNTFKVCNLHHTHKQSCLTYPEQNLPFFSLKKSANKMKDCRSQLPDYCVRLKSQLGALHWELPASSNVLLGHSFLCKYIYAHTQIVLYRFSKSLQ